MEPNSGKPSDILLVRDAVPSDLNYVFATFLKGLYHGNEWYRQMDKETYFTESRKWLSMLIVEGAQIKIACLLDEPDTFVGYSILSPNFQTVHWVHVKKDWRKLGVARMLLPAYPAFYSHYTELGKSLAFKIEGIRFNPFAK